MRRMPSPFATHRSPLAQAPERCRRPPWQRTQPSRADLRPIFRLGPRRIECPQAPELLDEEMVLPMLPTTLKGMVVQPALLRSGRCRGEQRLRHQVPVAEVPRGELRHLKMEQQIVHESHSSTAPGHMLGWVWCLVEPKGWQTT